MNRSRSAWWSLHSRKGHRSQGPEAAMFQGLRTRLTVWSWGVLGAALVLFSVVLYLAVQFFLLAPVEADTAQHAHAHVNQWLAISPARACLTFVPPGQFGAPPPGLGQSMFEMVACFDQNGSLLQNENKAQLPSAFPNKTLGKKAFREGQSRPGTCE